MSLFLLIAAAANNASVIDSCKPSIDNNMEKATGLVGFPIFLFQMAENTKVDIKNNSNFSLGVGLRSNRKRNYFEKICKKLPHLKIILDTA